MQETSHATWGTYLCRGVPTPALDSALDTIREYNFVVVADGKHSKEIVKNGFIASLGARIPATKYMLAINVIVSRDDGAERLMSLITNPNVCTAGAVLAFQALKSTKLNFGKERFKLNALKYMRRFAEQKISNSWGCIMHHPTVCDFLLKHFFDEFCLITLQDCLLQSSIVLSDKFPSNLDSLAECTLDEMVGNREAILKDIKSSELSSAEKLFDEINEFMCLFNTERDWWTESQSRQRASAALPPAPPVTEAG